MDDKPTDGERGRPRKSYLPPSRVGLKAVTAHVQPEWVVNLKVYGARTGRSLESLFQEALTDLADKLGIDLTLIGQNDAGDA